MGSISLTAIFIFAFILLPVAILKIGFELHFPLLRHKFSLPLEVKRFYSNLLLVYAVTYFGMLISNAIFEYFFSFELGINWHFIDSALFNKPSVQSVSFADAIEWPTFLFLSIVYFLSWLWGICLGKKQRLAIVDAISSGKDLFNFRDINMFGIWAAVLHTQDNIKVTIDILTTSDRVYTGKLYHYETNEDGLFSISLKSAQRFLVNLDEIKGKDEEKYLIPGEITFFLSSQIRNINIRTIEKETSEVLYISEKFNLDMLEEELKKHQEIFNKIRKNGNSVTPPSSN